MNTLAELWRFDSPVWLPAAVLLLGYSVVFRRASLPRFLLLGVGLGLMVLAFISPLGALADGYLFSAHMVQHLVLLLLVPLSFMLALPPRETEQLFARPLANRVGKVMAFPVVGCLLGVGAMWFWHVPSLCSASTENAVIGAVRDTSFVAAGLAFWWPVFSPVARYRLEPLSGITYLFTSCLGCTLLGIYITFTTVSVCPAFANPQERIDVVTQLYDAGLTPSVDQHLGGLLMWIPPCTLYVLASVALLFRWYGEPPAGSETTEAN